MVLSIFHPFHNNYVILNLTFFSDVRINNYFSCFQYWTYSLVYYQSWDSILASSPVYVAMIGIWYTRTCDGCHILMS